MLVKYFAGIIALLDIIYIFIFKGFGTTYYLIDEELGHPKYTFKYFFSNLLYLVSFYS